MPRQGLNDQPMKYLEDIHSTKQNAIAQLTDGANPPDAEVLAAAFRDHPIETQKHARLIAGRLMVQMDFVPEGVVEKIGDSIGAPDRRVQVDVQRFKELIEASRHQTGRWRGEVKRPDETVE